MRNARVLIGLVLMIAGSYSDTAAGQLVGGSYVIAPLDVNGGGGVSSNGVYSIASSAGQHGGVEGMIGGSYAIIPGFWPVTVATDCNGNGVDDLQDITGATSADCNLDAVPDECESVIFVDDSATNGLNNGSSWGNAFITLQDALTDAGSRCEITQVWVAEGTYRPDQGGGQTLLDRTATFQLLNGLAIFGGFVGTEVNLDTRDIASYPTVLSGDLASDDSNVACIQDAPDCDLNGGHCVGGECIVADNTGENSFHVVTGSGTTGSATISGFVISSGNANATSPDNRGAGMYNDMGAPQVLQCLFISNTAASTGGGIWNAVNSPMIRNCVFLSNSALGSGGGGGLANEGNSSAIVHGCVFSNNFAYVGGGVVNSGGNPRLTDCTLAGNKGFLRGGGILNNNGGSPIISGCVFSENTAGLGGGAFNGVSNAWFGNCMFTGNTGNNGGAVHTNGGDVAIVGCIVTGNSTTSGGGAIANAGWASLSLVNCSLSNNATGNAYSGGVLHDSIGVLTVRNSILWNNSDFFGYDEAAQIMISNGAAAVDYSCIQGLTGILGGTSNIGSDPLFMDEDGTDNIVGTEDDDLRLTCCSTAIDAGSNGAVPADAADLNSNGNTSEPVPIDRNGNPRFVNDPNALDCPHGGDCGTPPIVDMGAYESLGLLCMATIDCNSNGVTDECDLANLTSPDCNVNLVPDECDVFANVTWATSTGFWDAAGNWCPVGVPNNTTTQGFNVVIDGPTSRAIMDIDVTLDSLTTTNGAIVEVNNQSGGDRFLEVLFGFAHDGIVRAIDATRLTLGPATIVTGGILEAASNGEIILDGATADQISLSTGGGGQVKAQNSGLLVDPTIETVEIVNGNIVFIDGRITNNNETLINATSLPTALRPLSTAPSIRIQGPGTVRLSEVDTEPLSIAVVGDLFTSMINSTGHTIEGVGDVVGTIVNNRGTIRAIENGSRLMLVQSGLFSNTGTVHVDTNATMLVTSDMVCDTAGGSIISDAGAAIQVFGKVTVRDGARYEGNATGGFVDSSLVADDLILQRSSGAGADSVVELTDGMSVLLNGTGVVCDGPCDLRGCLSCRINVSDFATLAGGTIRIGDGGIVSFFGFGEGETTGSLIINTNGAISAHDSALLTIDGDVTLNGPGPFVFASSNAVTIRGNLSNRSNSPMLFDWLSGSARLAGAAPQVFEAAGRDLGGAPTGLVDNFAIGSLEIAAGADVTLIDQFDNDQFGQSSCTEALYVETLILGSGATLRLQDANMYYQTLVDNGGTVVPGCGFLNPILLGDFNASGGVDLADYVGFSQCHDGPDMPLAMSQCASVDMDRDGDVDLRDGALFAIILGAPN